MDKWIFKNCNGYNMVPESLPVVVKCLDENIEKCSHDVSKGYYVVAAILVVNRHKGKFIYNINYMLKNRKSEIEYRTHYVKNLGIRLEQIEKQFKRDSTREYWFKKVN